MLVLTRKCHEAVVVEEFGETAQKLTVTVLEIRGARVKLGFDVAKEVAVHRQEVWERLNNSTSDDSRAEGFSDRAQPGSIPFDQPEEVTP